MQAPTASINQPTNQPTSSPIKIKINQHQPNNQLTNQHQNQPTSINQSTNQTTNSPINIKINQHQSTNQPTNQPMAQLCLNSSNDKLPTPYIHPKLHPWICKALLPAKCHLNRRAIHSESSNKSPKSSVWVGWIQSLFSVDLSTCMRKIVKLHRCGKSYT